MNEGPFVHVDVKTENHDSFSKRFQQDLRSSESTRVLINNAIVVTMDITQEEERSRPPNVEIIIFHSHGTLTTED